MMSRPVTLGMVNVLNRIIPQAQRRQELLELVAEAGRNGCQLVLLPELADHHRTHEAIEAYSTGRPSDVHEKLAMTRQSPWLLELEGLARRFQMVVIPTVLLREGDRVSDTAVVIGPEGKWLGQYDKTHLAGGEAEYWQAGNCIKPIETPWGRIGLLICYDVHFPELTRCYELAGADLLLWTTMRHDELEAGLYEHVLPGRCITHCLPLAVSTYITDDQFVQRRQMTSTVWNSLGRVLAGGMDRQGILRCIVDLDERPRMHPRWDLPDWVDAQRLLQSQRRPDLYGQIAKSQEGMAALPEEMRE